MLSYCIHVNESAWRKPQLNIIYMLSRSPAPYTIYGPDVVWWTSRRRYTLRTFTIHTDDAKIPCLGGHAIPGYKIPMKNAVESIVDVSSIEVCVSFVWCTSVVLRSLN